MARTKSNKLKCTDKVFLKKQKGIVKDVLKRLFSSVSKGRGVVGVSLPIRIFEPRSIAERISDIWGYAHEYLTKAS